MAFSILAAEEAGAYDSNTGDGLAERQAPVIALVRPTEPEVESVGPDDGSTPDAIETAIKPTQRREVHAAGHEWEWQLRGACRDVSETEAEYFFHPWGERDPSRGRRDRDAKAICARCPVMEQCRDYALATREPYGVWGGLSEHEREDILGVRFG